MDSHVRVLQQRVEPPPVHRRLRQIDGERVLEDDHHEQKEELDGRDDGNDIRDQLPLALPVAVDGDSAEHRQQEHPEHDGAVEAAPVRGQLVEQRLGGVRIAVDVANAVVLADECVDDDRRRQGHQRRYQIERADTALNEAGGTATRPRYRRRDGIGAGDERGEQREGTKCGHAGDLYALAADRPRRALDAGGETDNAFS